MIKHSIKARASRLLKSIFFIILISSSINCATIDAQLKYTVIPDNPAPGEPVTIGVSSGVTEAVLFANNKQISKAKFFFIPGEKRRAGFLAAIITIPSTLEADSIIIKLNYAGGTVAEIPVELRKREYMAEVIHLDPVNTGIRTDPSPQRTQEANLLWQILTTTNDQVFHTGPFLPPTTATRRTSHFGDRRVYQYSTGGRDTSVHAGVDYGVPKGTRVDACGRGKVVLARMRIVTGNSVVIEHAPGIYSLYYHLDSISVKEGSIVETGDQIGLSGSTGLSTGPHLHWEVRVNAENTDPDAFVGRLLVDKDLLFRKLYGR